jgi:hypothetical protein
MQSALRYSVVLILQSIRLCPDHFTQRFNIQVRRDLEPQLLLCSEGSQTENEMTHRCVSASCTTRFGALGPCRYSMACI